MRLGDLDRRTALEGDGGLARSRVADLRERQAGERQAIGAERITARPDGVEHRAVLQSGVRQRQRHVGAQIGKDALGMIELPLQPLAAAPHDLLPRVDARGERLPHAGENVGGHEGVAVVGLPPAPAAVLVLERAEAL